MKGTTLISPFYYLEHFAPALNECKPSKIVLLLQKDGNKTLNENLGTLEKTWGKMIELQKIEVNAYDILDVAGKAVRAIDAEHKAGNHVVVNFTGGRKTVALGAYFAACLRKDKVSRVIYTPEEAEIPTLDLPKINLSPTLPAKKALHLLAKEKHSMPVAELAKKLGISRVMAYNRLKQLKNDGFINEQNEITTSGRLAIL